MSDEVQELQAKLVELGAELERATRRTASLEARLRDVDQQQRSLAARVTALESQNAQLSSLYVASYRLHESLERGDVLAVINEVLINIVGTEDFGVYELADGALTLVGSFGDTARPTLASAGPIAEALRDGAVRTFAESNGLVACIPLKLQGAMIGVITIFALLEHRAALTPNDHELFELLSTHAASALYYSRLHAAHGASHG